MAYYYFRCRSLTLAQRASKVLERYGVPNSVAKLPQKISELGCGYSLKIPKKYGLKAHNTILANGFVIDKIYLTENFIEFKEVQL